jgi:hypothetical protein
MGPLGRFPERFLTKVLAGVRERFIGIIRKMVYS